MTTAASTNLELAPDETLRARLALDLAADGHFANGELLLTDRRLVARVGGAADAQSWLLKPGLVLRHSDSGGLAQLSLHDADRRLALWRFTLAANPQALALLQQFERVQRRLAEPGTATDEDGSAEDTDFAADAPERSSTWVLLRLWRFAHPYRWQLLAGFVLTLGSTAASLVPQPVLKPAKRKTRYGVLYFGSTSPAMDEALDVLSDSGVHVDAMRLCAFPFPPSVLAFIEAHDEVFVVEQNRDAQMRCLLINELQVESARLRAVLHFDGTPITARFITQAITLHVQARAAQRRRKEKAAT